MEKIVIGSLSRLSSLIDSLKPYKVAYLTNNTIKKLWMGEILRYMDAPVIAIPDGERYKSIESAMYIWKILREMEFTRRSLLIGVGGGVITDLAGFVSSIFMRGTYLGLVPTTLLAQIDAAIGGKTGVNFHGKNMLGTFYPANFVLIAPETLKTLPQRELLNGLGEMVKYAILDSTIYRFLQNIDDPMEALRRDIIEACVNFKLKIVKEDMREEGKRRVLNLGHTVAHALEKLSNYQIKHGFAVSVGLLVAAFVGEMLYGFDAGKVEAMLHGFRLPTAYPASPQEVLRELRGDKKFWYGKIVFVVPVDIGDVRVETVGEEVIKKALEKVFK